jgi:multicomponent Na+:H+ antiporter subunit G
MGIATTVITILGQSLVLLGLLIIGFGVYAVLKLDSFYARCVVSAKVEAMGFVTVIAGAILLAGFSFMAVKLLVLLVFELLTVSAGAHAIVRSAWISGYRTHSVPLVEDGDG